MALAPQATKPSLAPTRPRLQAINQNFSDLGEQIRQAANIIGLPETWSTVEIEKARSDIIRNLVRARAEWVLRWVLDKLKDEGDVGIQCRAYPDAWRLLDWMVHTLPIARAAPHLRDARFLSILEMTLAENFGQDATLQPVPQDVDVEMSDISESSETIPKEPQPSRKRKRGASGVNSPSKRPTIETTKRGQLFHVIARAVKSVIDFSTPHERSEHIAQTENMKMVLRTESAQAARILKFWLTGVENLLSVDYSLNRSISEEFLDLSLVLDIWELRTVEGIDSGASAEEFSAECLLPTILLSESLRALKSDGRISVSTITIDVAIQSLDRLLVKHLLAPSRAAFFADANASSAQPSDSTLEAKALTSNLEPLHAKLLQSAQIEDSGQPIPNDFAPFFDTISLLLDLAVRASPSRTPKGRIAEMPWLQAVFLALADCTGCSLRAPEFTVVDASIAAMGRTLGVLQSHDIRINSDILKDLFWYHSGLEYPKNGKRHARWNLIAAIIELDPMIFLIDAKSSTPNASERPTDLVGFLFDAISVDALGDSGLYQHEHTGIDESNKTQESGDSQMILERIILPMMSAFAESRNLLGFFRHWDKQLSKAINIKRVNPSESIWENHTLKRALKPLFERYLTQSQISRLFQEHVERLSHFNSHPNEPEVLKKSSSSAVIISAVLQSVESDEIIETLRPQLLTLLQSYSLRARDDRYRKSSNLAHIWLTLTQLIHKLWAVELHGSSKSQKTLLYPLIEQATKDVSSARKTLSKKSVDNFSGTTAILFLLNSCGYLRSLPDNEAIIRQSLLKSLKLLSSSSLQDNEHSIILELFGSERISLLELLEAESRQECLLSLLSGASRLEDASITHIMDALSQSIFQHSNASLQNDYTLALLNAIQKSEQPHLQEISLKSLLQLNPSSLSREVRETLLDQLITTLDSLPQHTTSLLSIMARLMVVPNATAKLSSDATVFFNIAQILHDGKLESPSTLELMQNLVKLTLGHIIPNQNQTQNKQFLAKFQGRVASVVKKPKKCFPAKLAILRATVLAQKEVALLDLIQYVNALQNCLTEASKQKDVSLLSYILDAFNELPLESLQSHGLFNPTQSFLRTCTADTALLPQLLDSTTGSNPEQAQTLLRLHATTAKYRLYSEVRDLVDLTLRVFQEPVMDREKVVCLNAMRDAISQLTTIEKLDLVPILIQNKDDHSRAASYRIFSLLVSTLEDRHDADAKVKQRQLALLPEICDLTAKSANPAAFNALLDCINTILNNKASLISQHTIECVVAMLVKLTTNNSPTLPSEHASAIFSRICETSRLIILLHRSRLGGRFHLLLPLLQGLLYCLFIPHAGRTGALPPWLKSSTTSTTVRLTAANASYFTRLLSTLCSPTQSSVQKSTHHIRKSTSASAAKKDLNDPVKAAREYASSYLYPLLASFCLFQLNGRLEPGVREKLMPGVWEVVGCASLDRESIDAMFAGLDRSTRDVWRGVWGEWERLHGRKQTRAVDTA